jgi:hypothetical protein
MIKARRYKPAARLGVWDGATQCSETTAYANRRRYEHGLDGIFCIAPQEP